MTTEVPSFDIPAPTLIGAPLNMKVGGNAPKPASPKEKKPLLVPQNQHDLMRQGKFFAKAHGIGAAEVFLLGGVGTLVGALTLSWPVAVGTVAVLSVLSYVLGYRKLLSLLPLGIIVVATGTLVALLTIFLASLPYDQVQSNHIWFGIVRTLTLRQQITAGMWVGAVASLTGFFVFGSSYKEGGTDFETYLYFGAVLFGSCGGAIVWLVVIALGSIFNWGFGFGYGWFVSLLGGFLVTMLAGIGLICLLYVAIKSQGTWSWRDAARLHLENRFGETLDKTMQTALTQADEATIKAFLPHIAKDSQEELRALLGQGITDEQQPISEQEATQKSQDTVEQQTESAMPPQKTLDQWLSEGIGYARAGRYDEALAAYDRALALDPTSAPVWNQKGDVFHTFRRYQEARGAYDRAVQFASEDAHIWKSRGETLLALRQYDEALATYNSMLKLTPNDVSVWNSMGETFLKLEDHADALVVYNYIFELIPTDPLLLTNMDNALPLLLTNMGNTLFGLEQYKEAMNAYEQALELDEDFVPALNGRGNLLSADKQHQQAMADFDHALQVAPNDAMTLRNKGRALTQIKFYEQALAAFDRSLLTDPDNAETYSNKGDALFDMERYAEALALYERTLQLDPNWLQAWIKKGRALDALQRPKEGLAAYSRVTELAPNRILGWVNKGMALNSLKRYKDALAAFEEALKISEYNTTLLTLKGNVLISLERWQEARSTFEQVCALDLQNADARARIAWTYIKQKNYNKAEFVAGQALELAPKNELALGALQAVRERERRG